jgi:hypothetical protein
MGTENNLVLPLTSKETYLKLNKYISFDSSATRNVCLISGDHSQSAGLYITQLCYWLLKNDIMDVS